MSLAVRHGDRLKLGALASDAANFSRAAPHKVWLTVLGLVVVQAYLFARGHVASAIWPPGPPDWIVPFGLVLYVPLFGGLYRLALGGKRLRGLGPGGLQWRGLEWRLIGVAIIIALLIGMVALPFILINLLVIMLLGVRAQISLGPFGGWARWAPETALIWSAFLGS